MSKTKFNSFGKLLKKLRLNAGYGLRRFAVLIEMPASNLSAIEHGRRLMPKDKLILSAELLEIEKGSEQWNNFFDLDTQETELPADIQRIAGRGFVPALLRTIDNVQLSDKEIQQLITEIQQDGSSS